MIVVTHWLPHLASKHHANEEHPFRSNVSIDRSNVLAYAKMCVLRAFTLVLLYVLVTNENPPRNETINYSMTGKYCFAGGQIMRVPMRMHET